MTVVFSGGILPCWKLTSGTVRKVAWPEIFPWLGLVRTFSAWPSACGCWCWGRWGFSDPAGVVGPGQGLLRQHDHAERLRRRQRRFSWIETGEGVRIPPAATFTSPEAAECPTRPDARHLDATEPAGLADLSRRLEVRRARRWPTWCCPALWAMAVWAALRRRHQPHRRGPVGGRRADRLGGRLAIRRLEMALLFRRPAVAAARASCWPPFPLAMLGLLMRPDVGVLLVGLSGRWRCWPAWSWPCCCWAWASAGR